MKVQIMSYSAKPQIRPVANRKDICCFEKLCISITNNSYFDTFIMICILLNTVTLAWTSYGQSPKVEKVTDLLNYIFMAIFTLEAIIKQSS
jgi:hypothetical protein